MVVYDKPEETCNLESFKSCQPVTRLVPHLKDKDKCVGKKLMADDPEILILSWSIRHSPGDLCPAQHQPQDCQQARAHCLVLQGEHDDNNMFAQIECF